MPGNSRTSVPIASARDAYPGPSVRCTTRPRRAGALPPDGRRRGLLATLCTALAAAAILPGPVLSAQDLDPLLIRAQCRSVHDIEDQSLIYGVVTDRRSGTALPGSNVHLAWRTPSGISDTVRNHVETHSANGVFVFCDVPQNTALMAWADAAGSEGEREEFFFEGGESERRDLYVSFRRVTGAFAGQLLDAETGAPIEAARIRFPGTDREALSDRDGRFRVTEAPIGIVEARIQHIGYGSPVISVEVEPLQTTHMEIRLAPAAIEVEPLTVTIDVRPQWLEASGFYLRQERGLGQFVTPTDLERTPFRRFSEVLRKVPGVDIRNVCRPHCYQVIRMSTQSSVACPPTFYVDGKKMTTVREEIIDLDALAPNGDIAAVEVYRGISQTPAQFYGRCGSIVLWTLRGGRG